MTAAENLPPRSRATRVRDEGILFTLPADEDDGTGMLACAVAFAAQAVIWLAIGVGIGLWIAS